MRKIIGDLSDTDRVLVGLQLRAGGTSMTDRQALLDRFEAGWPSGDGPLRPDPLRHRCLRPLRAGDRQHPGAVRAAPRGPLHPRGRRRAPGSVADVVLRRRRGPDPHQGGAAAQADARRRPLRHRASARRSRHHRRQSSASRTAGDDRRALATAASSWRSCAPGWLPPRRRCERSGTGRSTRSSWARSPGRSGCSP